MKQVLVILMCFAGVLGLYVGVWVIFICGVIDILTAVRAEVLPIDVLVWGIAKCIFAKVIGQLSALLLV
jgi:hypothetical protein